MSAKMWGGAILSTVEPLTPAPQLLLLLLRLAFLLAKAEQFLVPTNSRSPDREEAVCNMHFGM